MTTVVVLILFAVELTRGRSAAAAPHQIPDGATNSGRIARNFHTRPLRTPRRRAGRLAGGRTNARLAAQFDAKQLVYLNENAMRCDGVNDDEGACVSISRGSQRRGF
jgi:hypothetical protein